MNLTEMLDYASRVIDRKEKAKNTKEITTLSSKEYVNLRKSRKKKPEETSTNGDTNDTV